MSSGSLAKIVNESMSFIRSNLGSELIPSNDGDLIEPVNISSGYNITKDSQVFGLKLNTLLSGEVRDGVKRFNLQDMSPKGNSLIAAAVIGKGENPLSSHENGVSINEDVSSLIFLHACAKPSKNQEAFFNIPDFFDTADLLGWYEITYEDGFKSIVPIQYGVNILEYDQTLRLKAEKPEPVSTFYCYNADPVNCSSDPENQPVYFYAYEWLNPRFGKVIKEVTLHGTVNYQATQRNFAMPVMKPMESNAIILAAISKVKKRELFTPQK
jgi:hypothetical protein